MRRRAKLHTPAALAAALLVWLLFNYGGYHPRHWGLAGIALALWTGVEIVRGRMPHPASSAGLAITAGAALTAWTALSILWADFSQHLAWEETGRTLTYLAAFAVGAAALGRGADIARGVTWIGAALGACVIYIAARIAFGGDALDLFVSGRLDWPIGYSNGMFAFCLIAAWLLIGISESVENRHTIGGSAVGTGLLSAAALGAATVAASLGVLAQSRAGLIATFVALLVALVAFPRPGALAWRLGLVLAATLVAGPRLGDAFQAQQKIVEAQWAGKKVSALEPSALSLTERAAETALIAGIGVALIVSAVTLVLVQVRLQRPHPTTHRSPAPLAAFVGVMVLIAGIAAAVEGSAVTWTKDQWSACRNVEPDERRTSPRSHIEDIGTNRCDFYRVALVSFTDNPAFGLGANNFQGEYVRKRHTHETPRQVHSLPLQLLSELGALGLLIGGAVAASIVAAALRFMRSGRLREPVVAGAVVALTQWAAHASLDWLWNLPTLTIAAALIAGALVASTSPDEDFLRRRMVIPATVGVALVSILALGPLVMSDRAMSRAAGEDPERSLVAAEDAEKYAPLWGRPPLRQAELLFEHGSKEDAADAARRAVEAEPGNWAVLWQAASILKAEDPKAAAKHRATALSLNPRARKLADPLADPLATRPATEDTQRPGAVAVSPA